ncbi:MAG: hypothetical protein ACXWQO_12530 [Bdellovibrionota bacterium]
MNWKSLLFLPLAALATGTPSLIPRLKEKIPPHVESGCPYEQALEAFLLAYAYSRENAEETRKFCQFANREANKCGTEAEVLKNRVKALCDF